MKPFWLCMLGTSAMTPTATRSHPAVYVQYEGLGMMLDVGEGAQRQLRKAHINQSRIRLILLSHWHADHALGLPGLLQSLMIHHVRDEVVLLGPLGSQRRLQAAFRAFGGKPEYPLRVLEAPADREASFSLFGLIVRTLPLPHAQPTLAFRIEEPDRWRVRIDHVRAAGIRPGPCLKALQEGRDAECNGMRLSVAEYAERVPGRSLVYATDFSYTPDLADFAREADVFICEATYADEHAVKAAEHAHVTARDAGRLAQEARVKLLVLTHFSQRYDDTRILVEEACEEFAGQVIAAEDFLRVDLAKKPQISSCSGDIS